MLLNTVHKVLIMIEDYHRAEFYCTVNIYIYIIVSEASFLVCSMARIFYIYIYMYGIFQAVRRAVNILNVSTCI